MSEDDVRKLCQEKCVVVIDEAYIEFAGLSFFFNFFRPSLFRHPVISSSASSSSFFAVRQTCRRSPMALCPPNSPTWSCAGRSGVPHLPRCAHAVVRALGGYGVG
jgi:hypothetical protein